MLRLRNLRVFDALVASRKRGNCRTAARLNKRNPPLPPAEYKQRICSWLGWAQHSNSKHLLKTIIKPKYYASVL